MTTTTTTVTLEGAPRPVRDDVLQLMDDAIGRLGGELLHAMDPARIVGFEDGGPAVWSVGLVEVAGDRPYTLLVTYGFSEILSPESCRAGITHEYSLAVPADSPLSPWADALLRHLSRYALTSGSMLHVGDVMPCYAPITCVPFQPEHHAYMPPTSLVGILVTDDPVLPGIATPHGTIQIRRMVGIDQRGLDRIQTWSTEGFLEELDALDPLLLTALERSSFMDVPAFATIVDMRARHEGSRCPAFVLEARWDVTDTHLEIELPGGREAAKLIAALHGRLPFGEPLTVISRVSPPITFLPGMAFDIQETERGLELTGSLDSGGLAKLVASIDPRQPGTTIQIPFAS